MAEDVPNPIRAVIDLVRADPRMEGAIGEFDGPEPLDEIEHFYACASCGQPVDMRDLGQVFHHEDKGHQPLPVEDEARLLRISDQLRTVLAQRERDG